MIDRDNYQILPLQDRVLVRLLEPGKTPGGLVLPDSYEDSMPRAEVLAVGPGEPLPDGRNRAPLVHVGDHVLLEGTARGVVVDKVKRLWLTRESAVLAVLKGAGAGN